MAVRTYFFQNVTARIGSDDPLIVQALRSNLYHLGCRDIRYTADPAELRAWVSDVPPDLLVVQSDLGGSDSVCDLFRRIRLGELGPNPFIPLIAVTQVAETELVKSLINAGTDDVLPFPWPEQYLDQRLDKLIYQRKQFVVTSDYIGPDRRSASRPGERFAQVTPLDVPNPLRAKAVDRLSDEDFARIVAEGAAQLQVDRIRRLGELAVRLTSDLAVLDERGAGGSALGRTCLERLVATTTGIQRRVEGTNFEAVGGTCRTLNRTAKLLLKGMDEDMGAPELHLLRSLTENFARDFGLNYGALMAEQAARGFDDAETAAAQA